MLASGNAPRMEQAIMSQHYSNPERESNPTALPDLEVFELTAIEAAALDEDAVYEYSKRHEYRLASMNSTVQAMMLGAMVDELGIAGGWFCWYCFPGCLPDGPAIGPFKTHAAALACAREDCADCGDELDDAVRS
jgi:hypothetical protein